MTTNVEELKLLLALNGNSRILYLENEIFANSELTLCYLAHMHAYRTGNPVMYLNIEDVPWVIYAYARDIIKGRWVEAEPTLFSTSNLSANLGAIWACHYARIYSLEPWNVDYVQS